MLRYFCNSAVPYICEFDSIFVRTQSSSSPMKKMTAAPLTWLKNPLNLFSPSIVPDRATTVFLLTFLLKFYTFSAGASFWQLVLEKDVGPFDLVGKSGHVWLSEPYTGCGPPLCARHNVHLEPYMDLMHCLPFCKQVERDIQLEWLMAATGEHIFSSWIISPFHFSFGNYQTSALWDASNRLLFMALRKAIAPSPEAVFVVFQFRAHICV